ncbi:MAG: recombination-associated protein RdgC [Planctomycetota bacterium]
MPITSGRVSYCRFRVQGDAPDSVDETFLDLLHEHHFRETEIGAPDEVETGWVTAEHLMDTAFTYDKIAYGPFALFALRLDTHKVPGEVKKAYQKMNEQAAAKESPTGFASKAEKREAKDLANRQVQEDLAAGRFRRSRSVQIAWDLRNGLVFCGNASGSVVEQLVRLFRKSFAAELTPMTGGTEAGYFLSQQGKSRDYEDLLPSAFTKPPVDAGNSGGDDDANPRDRFTPICPWVTKSIDLKDFIGNEWLTWLWHQCEANEGIIETEKAGDLFVTIHQAIDLDCAWEVGGKVTVRCDKPTSLAESDDALKTGKWPRKLGLILSDGESQWDLTISGDTLNVSAALLPDITEAQTPREVIEQRLTLIGSMSFALDQLYQAFLRQRTASGWSSKREAMSKWIKQRGNDVKASTPEVAAIT